MPIKKKVVIAWFLVLIGVCILALTAVSAMRAARSVDQNDQLQITASIYPIAYFTQRVAGDRAIVTTITPVGIEPHDYEPTVQDFTTLEESDLIVLNGAGIEPWLDSVGGYSTKRVVLEPHSAGATDGDSDATHGEAADREHPTLHSWLNPKVAQQQVTLIEEALILSDPEHKSAYAQRADALRTELESLQQVYVQQLAVCEHDTIITTHDAFGHLLSEYGFTQMAVLGPTPDEEPSLQRIAEVVDFMRAAHITYVFSEPFLGSRVAQTIAAESGATVLSLDPIEGLTLAQLEAGDDYFTIQRQNVQNLALALECTE